MATAGRRGKYQVWQREDMDDTNASLLISPATATPEPATKKPSCCAGFGPVFLLMLGACLAFLLGICVGYYVRESQKFDDGMTVCGTTRSDKFDPAKLNSIHENIMYFMSGQKVREFVSDVEADVAGGSLDQRLERKVREQLEELQLDSLKVEEHRVVTTVPHPSRPSALDVLDGSGTPVLSLHLSNGVPGARVNRRSVSSDDKDSFPIVAFSPAGTAQGGLLYGHYGSLADLQVLLHHGLDPASNLLLLRLGRIPVWDKLHNAAEAGAVGVLLFWDPQDRTDPDYVFNASFVPHQAARPSDLRSDSLASLPAQTLSSLQAQQLLQRMGIEVFAPWQGGLRTPYRLGGLQGNMTAKLVTFNRVKEKIIRNVIGNMQGFTERDHYVLVGAPRAGRGEGDGDVVASTALLLQLAHYLAHFRQVKQWRPRRGIKLCSWGGSDLGHAGMALHIQSRPQVLRDRALAYVDLSQLVLGNDSMAAMTTAALHRYINEASFRVPDPNDAAYSVHDLARNSSDLGPQQIPNLGYLGNPDNFLFLHQLGIPVMRLQHVSANRNQFSTAEMASMEEQHHYRYHIGVMRVLTLALLSQADDVQLPYSVKDYTHDIHLSVWQTSEVLRDCSQDTQHMAKQESMTDDLVEAGNAFSLYIQTSQHDDNAQNVRMTNDAKMLFERSFVAQNSRGTHHVLYPTSEEGVILAVQEACVLGKLTGNWTLAQRIAGQLQQQLNQALDSLRMAD